MITTFKDVIWKGKSIYDCKITRDMTNEQVVIELVKAIEAIEKEIDLSQVNLKALGIVDSCKLQYKNLLTEILNSLIAKDTSFAQQLTNLQQAITNQTGTQSVDTDELVKTTKADPTAGYLADKVVSDQTGSIKVVNDKLSIMGFAPVGTVLMIDNGRVADFDPTGKGKAGTDLWGWAISNGQNGTRNRLGKFPRFVGVLADAGKTGGSNTQIMDKLNIGGFDLAVSGAINEALATPITAKIMNEVNHVRNSIGGGDQLLRWTPLKTGRQTESLPLDVKHSHTFTLKATHTNPNPIPLSIVPEYIYEIPIQRIL